MPISTKRTYTEFVTDCSFVSASDEVTALRINSNNIPRSTSFKLLKTNNYSLDSDENENEQPSDSEFAIKFKPSTIFNEQSIKLNVSGSNSNNTVTSANEDVAFNATLNFVANSPRTERRKSLSRPGSFSSSRRNIVSKQDLIARERCFDYIVQSIDEAWALYCDTTASAEAIVYGDMNSNTRKLSGNYGSNPLKKFRISDDEEETEFSEDDETSKYNIKSDCTSRLSVDDYNDAIDTSGYKSETTNVTEYETDSSDCRTVSELPDCIKFQSLKCRLSKAKYDLEQYYDSKDYSDCVAFWNRWDMIKYSAVEIMEDDDDDEVVEGTLEELEGGRCYIE